MKMYKAIKTIPKEHSGGGQRIFKNTVCISGSLDGISSVHTFNRNWDWICDADSETFKDHFEIFEPFEKFKKEIMKISNYAYDMDFDKSSIVINLNDKDYELKNIKEDIKKAIVNSKMDDYLQLSDFYIWLD